MTIKEIIDAAYSVYLSSLNKEDLEASAASLRDVVKSPIISDANRENAQFLNIKIGLKILAAEYFGYFENKDFRALENYAGKNAEECRKLGFAKTEKLINSVMSAASAVNGIMFDAVALKSRICDNDGRCVAKDADECREVSAALQTKIAHVRELDLPVNVFTDGASFPDVKKETLGALDELCALSDRLIAEFEKEQIAEVFKSGVEDITEKLNAAHYEYFPSLSCVDGLAKTIVLFTPFGEEAEILAWVCAGGAKVCRVQALAFEGKTAASAKAVFDELARRKSDCLIYGMPRFRGKNRADFLREAMRFGKSGRRVFIVADDGTRAVYDWAIEAAVGEFSSIDVSFLYLSMPDFKPTVEEMQRLGMIDGVNCDIDYVRKNMPFMGFAGLNEAVKAFAVKADWKKIAGERSSDNFPAAERYMLRLSRQALFIDSDWGNYHEDIVLHKAKRFDYDDISVVNPNNVRKIMEGNFTLFQKCGMISTYCLLCGSSAADWADLPPEIKSERLTEASKLVMRALGLDIVPVVQVLEKMDKNGAGGTCYDGGKRIVYKDSCVKDFDWTSKAVCHECFHAFQHMAYTNAWQDWYETELHVTPGRVEMWKYNFSKYRDIDKDFDGYMIQIVECDARAFESDCLGKNESMGQILNLIDLD